MSLSGDLNEVKDYWRNNFLQLEDNFAPPIGMNVCFGLEKRILSDSESEKRSVDPELILIIITRFGSNSSLTTVVIHQNFSMYIVYSEKFTRLCGITFGL